LGIVIVQSWIFLVFAVVSGVLMALQGSINGALGKIIGTLEGNFTVHAIGLAAVALLLFAFGLGRGDLGKSRSGTLVSIFGWRDQCRYYIWRDALYSQKAAQVMLQQLSLPAKLAMALIIDWLGLFGLEKFPMTWGRGTGLVLMAIAAKLLLAK